MTTVSFGTSGHRGIMGDAFSHDHIRAIGYAVATHLKKEKKQPEIIIGYDPRQGNHPEHTLSYTHLLAEVLSSYGCTVLLCDTYTPTPVISWYITHHHCDGGLILTASHNPPEYNGIKFNPSNGAPAPVETTDIIQTLANDYLENPIFGEEHGHIKSINPTDSFAKNLAQKCIIYLNSADLSGQRIAVDAKHGATTDTWNALADTFKFDLHLVHETPLPDFGHCEPNPTRIKGLDKLQECQATHHCTLSASNDPDGDRHQLCDENGAPLSPEETCTILIDYMIDQNLPLKGVASTLASSQLIKKACQHHNITYEETKVGFKYFAPFLEKAKNQQHIAFGVESSGGFSASFHTLEKCGFLPVILMMMILKQSGKSLSQLKQESLKRHGTFYFVEDEYRYEAIDIPLLKTWLSTCDQKSLQSHFKETIHSLNREDGLKINFEDESWCLVRLSGTEPVARLYAESHTHEKALAINAQSKVMVQQIVATKNS